MRDLNPIERKPHAPLECEQWEALLADALDGVLPPGDAAAFEQHVTSCKACSGLLESARQGQEWLRFLHHEPEPSSDLMARILDRTSGVAMPASVPVTAGGPQAVPAGVLHAQRMWVEPRLLMTAAMAFFSIALTLNLVGVHITQLRAADLAPSAMSANLSHQFYSMKTQAVRYYDNLRVVYEVEARLRELRRESDTAPATSPSGDGKRSPKKSGGSSARPDGDSLSAPARQSGTAVFASCPQRQPQGRRTTRYGKLKTDIQPQDRALLEAASLKVDQAEGSLV